jgi:hypothetical protein
LIAYRVAASRPRSRSLFAVHLVGGARTMHRAQAVVRIGLALAALVAYFVPWHAVHMVGTEIDGLKERPTFTCTGWSHVATPLPVAALLGTILLAWLAFRWPKMTAALFLPTMTLGALLAIRYAIDNPLHRFDRIVPLDGERAFSALWTALVLAALLDLVLVPLLYAWTRARLQRSVAHSVSASGSGTSGGGNGGSSGV